MAEQAGTCVPIEGAPEGARAPCAGEGPCAGASDGADRTRCSFPAAGTECAPAVCKGDSLRPSAGCDGSGLCVTPQAESCGRYACDAEQGRCLSACSTDNDCAAGSVCDAAAAECVVILDATCADGVTLVEPGGAETSCAPYVCAAGACKERCSGEGDCASGATCEASRCVDDGPSGAGGGAGNGGAPEMGGGGGDETTSDGADAGGCGCRLVAERVPSGSPAGWALGLALGGFGLGRCRRAGRGSTLAARLVEP